MNALAAKEKEIHQEIKYLEKRREKIKIEFENCELDLKAHGDKTTNDLTWDLHTKFAQFCDNAKELTQRFKLLSDIQAKQVLECHHFIGEGLCGLEGVAIYGSFKELEKIEEVLKLNIEEKKKRQWWLRGRFYE